MWALSCKLQAGPPGHAAHHRGQRNSRWWGCTKNAPCSPLCSKPLNVDGLTHNAVTSEVGLPRPAVGMASPEGHLANLAVGVSVKTGAATRRGGQPGAARMGGAALVCRGLGVGRCSCHTDLASPASSSLACPLQG